MTVETTQLKELRSTLIKAGYDFYIKQSDESVAIIHIYIGDTV